MSTTAKRLNTSTLKSQSNSGCKSKRSIIQSQPSPSTNWSKCKMIGHTCSSQTPQKACKTRSRAKFCSRAQLIASPWSIMSGLPSSWIDRRNENQTKKSHMSSKNWLKIKIQTWRRQIWTTTWSSLANSMKIVSISPEKLLLRSNNCWKISKSHYRPPNPPPNLSRTI